MKIQSFTYGLLFALAACNDIGGTLSVNSSLDLLNKKGKPVTLQAGGYESSLKLDQDDNEIELKVKNVNGKDQKVVIKIPAGVTIPTVSGDFRLTAAQTGQHFDLGGDIDTQVENSSPIRSSESCSYTRSVYECWDEPFVDQDNCTRYAQRCGYRDVTSWGQQPVEYYNKTTTVTGHAEFVDPQNQAILAKFAGQRSASETIYTYRGECY